MKKFIDNFYKDFSNSFVVKINMYNYVVIGFIFNISYNFVIKGVDSKGNVLI